MSTIFGGLFDGGAARQDDQVGQRNLFAAVWAALNSTANTFESFQHFGQLGGLVDSPVLLGREAECARHSRRRVCRSRGT